MWYIANYANSMKNLKKKGGLTVSSIYYGIDLGTSSSSISYIVDSPRVHQAGYIEPATVRFMPPLGASVFRNQYRLPSAVYVERKGDRSRIITGFGAEAASNGKLTRAFEDFFMSAKSDMGTLKIYEDSVHPDISTPADVSAQVLRELIKAAEQETGISPKDANVVITVPASFTHSQRQDTLCAARMAGLNIGDGDLLDEPIAAFLHTVYHQKFDAYLDTHLLNNSLMFDLGAGTCDISVFRTIFSGEESPLGLNMTIETLAISNYEKLGGDNIDLHMVEEEILPALCRINNIDFNEVPEKTRRELRFRLKMKARQVKEELCRQMGNSANLRKLRQHYTVDPFIFSDSAPKTKRMSAFMSYEQFRELLSPFITDDIDESFKIADDYVTYSFYGPVLNALEKAGLQPADIDAFIFNGGSCHNPLITGTFQRDGRFRNASFFQTPDLDLSVSKGAAIHCYALHRHNRSVIAPIVNSEIGIVTHGAKREILVAAGTKLPFPGDGDMMVKDTFCVPRDNLRQLCIPIYSGNGRVVTTLRLPLPEGTDKGDSVSIGLSIDSNKVMHFNAFMTDSPEVRISAELSNPWNHVVTTPEDLFADELWQEVAALRKEKKTVSQATMVELANRERLRGHVDGAIEILQRLHDHGSDSGRLNNLMGLCYGARGQGGRALEHYKKAAEKDPADCIVVSNYGSQLIENGKLDEGMGILQKASVLDPDYYHPHYWLGYAYRQKGDAEQSRKEYERALQLIKPRVASNPTEDYYLGFLHKIHLSLGNYEEADEIKRQRERIRLTRLLGGSPDDLIAGAQSGIWKEDELFAS